MTGTWMDAVGPDNRWLREPTYEEWRMAERARMIIWANHPDLLWHDCVLCQGPYPRAHPPMLRTSDNFPLGQTF